MRNNKLLLEGLLFIAGDEGLTLSQLAKALSLTEEDCRQLINELSKDLQEQDRALELAAFAAKYKLVTKEEVYEIAEQFFKEEKSTPLSSSALETLAIIAYKQPITRVEIEEIRGVNCEVILKRLAARDLIEECGRLETVGRPIIYQVTANFLDLFKLNSLAELPKFETLYTAESDFFNLKGQ